jgi:uncharacterized membrane protein
MMTKRIAAALSMIVFALCLVIGAFEANNGFVTTVQRALVAMMVTLIVGLIVGWMAQKMLDENLKKLEQNTQNSAPSAEPAEK